MLSSAPHESRGTMAGAPKAAVTLSGIFTSGLHTSCARTAETSPETRASRSLETPTQYGLPRCHPRRRCSTDPRSGPSSSSGAAAPQALHRPPVLLVRISTLPEPRHDTPASVNRGRLPGASNLLEPCVRRSTVVDVAVAEPNAAGTTA